MRVCIIALNDFFDTYGGTEVYVRNLVNELIKQKHITPFIISKSNKNQQTIYKGITIYSITQLDDMKAVLSPIQPDIVHANGMFDWAVPICNELGIKCIITMHIAIQICPIYTLLDYKGQICNKNMSIHNCLRCMLSKFKGGQLAYPFVRHIPQEKYIQLGRESDKHSFILYITPVLRAALGIQESMDYWNKYICPADKIIQINPHMAALAKQNGIPEEKIALLPNGIPKVEHTPPFPSYETGVKFFYTGRLDFTKGVHILLSAFHKLKNKTVELHIIGDDNNPYAQNLKQKYRKDQRVIWHGFVPHEDINNVISPFHVCILPSIVNETSSLSILEALAMGKYIIASRLGGPESLINEEVNGRLVTPNNIHDLYIQLKEYATKPIAPSQIIYTTMEEHTSHLCDIYHEVLNS